MADTSLALRFQALFAGRTDAWGAVHGESKKQQLTLDLIENHLFGDGSVGIYPLLDNGTCRWGCIDVDEGYDLIAIALNVQKALKALGITAWIERTKNKGHHVWTFSSAWVGAEQMVAAQRVACSLADYHPKEVNPKQTHLDPGQIGNYVNCPYAKTWADKQRRVILRADRSFYGLAEFLDAAERHLTPPAVIAKAAALYVAPPPPAPVEIARPTVDPAPRLRGVARKLFEEGPLPSLTTGRVDRSAALQRLAHLLRTDGFSAGEAYALVCDLDGRLGKYVGRGDADVQYQRIIARAFS